MDGGPQSAEERSAFGCLIHDVSKHKAGYNPRKSSYETTHMSSFIIRTQAQKKHCGGEA